MEGLNEAVEIQFFGPDARDIEVGKLKDPWIGDEGPREADFRRGRAEGAGLRLRGVAFDDTTTVVWDEDGVQVLRSAPLEDDAGEIVALRSQVLVHSRFKGRGLDSLVRIDYLKRGALLGSRFLAGEDHA